MEEYPPTIKRTMEFPTEGQPPSKQTNFDSANFSCTSNEQNSTEKNPGLEDDSVSSGNKGCGEGCENDEKFHNETERNEETHGVKKIQPEVEPVPVPPPGPIQFTSVQPNSISLVWGSTERWSGLNFKVTWESGGTVDSREVRRSKACIHGLSPGEKYEFKVVTLGKDNQQSKCVSATTHTEIPAPEELKVKRDEDLVVVTWRKPERLDQVEYVLSLWKKGKEGGEEECLSTITATSEEYPLRDLEFNMTYIVKVSIVLKNGCQGKPATLHIGRVPAPEQLAVSSVTPTSVDLTWSPPHGMDQTPESYQISYHSEGTDPQTISTVSCSAVITDLMRYTNYSISVCTKLKDGGMSEPETKEVRTAVPCPGNLTVVSVTPTSAELTWSPPRGMNQTLSYQVSYHKGGSHSEPFSTHLRSAIIEDLEPCTDYMVSICTKLKDGGLSGPRKQLVHTAVSAPEQLIVDSVTPTSINLTWSPAHGMDQTPHSYQISYHSGGTEPQIISASLCSEVITGLKPYTNYSVSVCTKVKDDEMSGTVRTDTRTAVPAPEQLTVASVTPTSVHLTWTKPHGMDQTPHSYQISYHSGGSESNTFSTDLCSADITGLKPYTNYSVSISTKLKDGGMSKPENKEARTALPGPEQVTVVSVTLTSIHLTWSPPHGMDQTPESYQISYHKGRAESKTMSTLLCSDIIKHLEPCTMYMVSVFAKFKDGGLSEPMKKKVHTAVPAPEKLTGVSISPTSVHLTWLPPLGMEQTPHSYLISYHSGGTKTQTLSTDSCSEVITGLKPYTNYSVSVCTKVMGDEMSEAVRTEVRTAVAAPKQLTVVSVTPTSAHLTWLPPHGMDQTPYSYHISGGTEPLTIPKDSCRADIRGLNPYTNYSVSICTKVTDDEMSEAVRTEVLTAVPGPEQITVVSVTPTSAELTWSPPNGMDQTLESYQISYHKEGARLKTISANSCCSNITGLKPCTSYTVSIRVKLTDGGMSEAVGKVVHTGTPVPQKLKVASVTPTSAKLTWNPPHGMDQTPHSYQISYHSERPKSKTTSNDSCSADITGLKPCTDYVVRVCTKPNNKDWKMSEAVEIKVHTTIPAPEQLIVDSVTAITAELRWSPPHGMDQTPDSYQISYHRKGADPLTISTNLCSAVITSLQPDTDYIISVCAEPKDERMSEPVKKKIHTEILTRNYYTIVIGNTQNHHLALKGMLTNKALKEVKHVESCDLILAFCVIVSRVGTDMEAALKEIPDCKPAVLAVMHHTFDPDHVTPDTSRFVRGRNIMVVDILFHEDKGILRCQKNTEAQSKMHEMVWTCSEPGRPKKLLLLPQAQPPPATRHTKTDASKNSASNPVPSQRGYSSGKPHEYQPESKESPKKTFGSSASSTEFKFAAIVSGNTLGADKDVKKRLTDKGVLPKEVSSAAQCNFLLVFCPIVSSVGSDIEKALKQIPDGKPYILVVMHHTFNADYLPPDTRRYAKDKDMLIVDCLFYEDSGLLKCQRNDEALDHVSKWIGGKFPNFVEKSQNMSWSYSTGGSLFSRFPGISWGSNKK